MEYYSANKKNALMRWMNLEPIIQSEVSQKGKDEYHILKHRKAIPKNAQTTGQLHSSHTLVK